MIRLFVEMSRFLHDRRGVTALEYALIAGLIAAVIATSVTTLGTGAAGMFTSVANKL